MDAELAAVRPRRLGRRARLGWCPKRAVRRPVLGPSILGAGRRTLLLVPLEAANLLLTEICPRPWKNASYDGDDGDAFLGADGGGVGRPTGSCGLSEAIRF